MPAADAFVFGYVGEDFLGGGELVVYLVEIRDQHPAPVGELVEISGGFSVLLVDVAVALVEPHLQFDGLGFA